MLAAIRDRTTWSLVEGGKQASWTPGHVRVPKNGDSRSKRFLEPRPLPHQYWGLEFRTSLTGAQDDARRRSAQNSSNRHCFNSLFIKPAD